MEGGESKKTEEETKKRKRDGKNNKKTFIYGNYNSYYGYRVDRNQEEDPRLAVFKREWFEGRDCLDIGCNQGLITISIGTILNFSFIHLAVQSLVCVECKQEKNTNKKKTWVLK